MQSRKRQNLCYPFQTKGRSNTGCLSCRRRRKKCDERRPSCKACARNFLECIWPHRSGKQRLNISLSKNKKQKQDPLFQQRKLGYRFNLFLLKDANFLKLKTPSSWVFDVLIVDPATGIISRKDSLDKPDTTLCASESGEDDDVYRLSLNSRESNGYHDDITGDLDTLNSHFDCSRLDLQLSPFPQIEVQRNALIQRPSNPDSLQNVANDHSFLSEKSFDSLFQRCKNNEPIPDVEFDDIDVENFAFFACIKGYIPKMTTQHTHQNLTTSAAFIPQLGKNPIMREVFLCCGATYLAWNNLKKFQNMSDELYMNCKILIQNFIDEHPDYADEDWLFVALQLLCNRDKNSLTATEEDAKWHLMRAFDIIRLRYYGKDDKKCELSIIEIISNSNLVLRPYERTLIESFIFQYSVSLLFIDNVDELPNPFKIFKILNAVLKCPVYDCEYIADWMSNPILGPSLDSFELLAKLSYIGHMQVPLNREWAGRVVSLTKMCQYYTPTTPAKKMTEIQWQNYQINSNAGIITSTACWLFARKILELDAFDHEDQAIQNAVKKILLKCKEIPAGNRVWGILPWAIFMTGVFSVDFDDRSYILELNGMMAERAHSYNGFRISSFLRRAWASGSAPNFLFVRGSLMHINM